MASKPGRPPTSTTRHGNGRGHGGPAKGAGRGGETLLTAAPFTPENQPPSNTPNYRTLAKQARIEALKEMLWGRAFDVTEETRDRINAANSVLNREEGLPIARTMDMRNELEKLTDEQLNRAIGELRDALGGSIGASGAGAGEEAQSEQVGRVSPLH